METTRKKLILSVTTICAVLFAVVIILFSSVKRVPDGYIGVEVKLSKITGRVFQEGYSFVIPFSTKIINYNLRLQSINEVSISGSLSGDELWFGNVTMKYKIDPSQVVNIYRTAGLNYETSLIPQDKIQGIVKSVLATYSIDDFGQKRSLFEAETCDALNAFSMPRGIIFDSVAVVNYTFDQEMEAAMTAKNLAAQTQKTQQITLQTEREAAEAQKEIARVNAEKEAQEARIKAESAAQVKKINAQAEAEAIKIQAEAEAEAKRLSSEAEAKANEKLAASLTPELIQYNEVAKWNGSRATIVGSDTIITQQP